MSDYENNEDRALESNGDDSSPKLGSSGFDCPHCGAYALMNWHSIFPDGDHRYAAILEKELVKGTLHSVCCWANCYNTSGSILLTHF